LAAARDCRIVGMLKVRGRIRGRRGPPAEGWGLWGKHRGVLRRRLQAETRKCRIRDGRVPFVTWHVEIIRHVPHQQRRESVLGLDLFGLRRCERLVEAEGDKAAGLLSRQSCCQTQLVELPLGIGKGQQLSCNPAAQLVPPESGLCMPPVGQVWTYAEQCTRAHTHTRTHVRAHAHTRTHTHTHTHTHTRAHTHERTHVCARVPVRTLIHDCSLTPKQGFSSETILLR
jgi:hypothetical protein